MDRDGKGSLRGTIVCGCSGGEDCRSALRVAVELSERLRLRLVLAHVSERVAQPDRDVSNGESLRMKACREAAPCLARQLAADSGLADRIEHRSGIGEPAALLGRIAAEEAADLIVVGARARGRLRRGLESRLAEQLEAATPVPVLIAPPWDGR